MKKILIVLTMCLIFLSSVAHADHWRVKSSLVPGKYMLTYMSVDQTSAIYQLYEAHSDQKVEPATSIVYVGFIVVFEIDDKYNASMIADFLDTDKQTTPDHRPELFKLEVPPDGESWWRQIPLPLTWTKGDKVM